MCLQKNSQQSNVMLNPNYTLKKRTVFRMTTKIVASIWTDILLSHRQEIGCRDTKSVYRDNSLSKFLMYKLVL